jgi:hypothetical protein
MHMRSEALLGGATAFTLAFNLLFPASTQAATLYFEDFTGQEGKGLIGGSSPDLSGVDWTIEQNDAALFNDDDYIQVENGQLTARDTNAGCGNSFCSVDNPTPTLAAWLSPIIDISGYTNLLLNLEASGSDAIFEVDGGVNSEDDFIVSYELDGVWFTSADLVTQTGAFPAQNVSTAIADGDSLRLKVELNNYASDEFFFLDNIIVTGDAVASAPSTPEPASLLGLAAIAGIGLATRRKLSKTA